MALSWSTSRSRAAASLASSSVVLDGMTGVSMRYEHVEHGVYEWECRPSGMAKHVAVIASTRICCCCYSFSTLPGVKPEQPPLQKKPPRGPRGRPERAFPPRRTRVPNGDSGTTRVNAPPLHSLVVVFRRSFQPLSLGGSAKQHQAIRSNQCKGRLHCHARKGCR